MIAAAKPREQTRARYPDQECYVERDGVRVFCEVYGDAADDIPALPTTPTTKAKRNQDR
jgi:hypothetical protein